MWDRLVRRWSAAEEPTAASAHVSPRKRRSGINWAAEHRPEIFDKRNHLWVQRTDSWVKKSGQRFVQYFKERARPSQLIPGWSSNPSTGAKRGLNSWMSANQPDKPSRQQ